MLIAIAVVCTETVLFAILMQAKATTESKISLCDDEARLRAYKSSGGKELGAEMQPNAVAI